MREKLKTEMAKGAICHVIVVEDYQRKNQKTRTYLGDEGVPGIPVFNKRRPDPFCLNHSSIGAKETVKSGRASHPGYRRVFIDPDMRKKRALFQNVTNALLGIPAGTSLVYSLAVFIEVASKHVVD